MSLRLRIVAAIALVLLLGSAASLGVAGWRSKLALREELSAAMAGGRQTVVSAFEDLPRSDHPERDLRQLVATFDGNRHLLAAWTDGWGRLSARSRPRPASLAPAWFASALATRGAFVSMPVPVFGHGAILLEPAPEGDIGVLWRELLDLAAVFGVSLAIGAAGVWLLVGRALRPLARFSNAFTRIGGGDYAARVGQPGPPELARLGRGIDEMAARLGAMQRRNRTLENQIERLQEEERADLARDLHDEIGPQLFAANIDAASAKALLTEGRGDEARDRLTAIQSALGHAQALVRDILGRLRPVDLVELGLAPAIQGLARFWQSRRPEIRFDIGLT
ncbi:MAG: histidine kinase, partial [Caulobacteraceae bacterium]